MEMPKFIAHRGASKAAPENTLKAFKKAAQLGAKMVEFDVQLTKDGVPVVIHDETIDCTTNGCGKVIDFSLAELQQFDAGEGECIPSLGQVFDCLQQEKLMANIEIKPCAGTEAKTVLTVLNCLAKNWRQSELPLISSFSMPVLNLVREENQLLPMAALFEKLPDNWQEVVAPLSCISINLNQNYVSAAQIALIKKAGYQVMCYTVDEAVRAEQLFTDGVAAVFTNDIARMGSLI